MMPAGTRNDQRGPRVYTEGNGGTAKHRERDRASTRDNDVHNVSNRHIKCCTRKYFYLSGIVGNIL